MIKDENFLATTPRQDTNSSIAKSSLPSTDNLLESLKQRYIELGKLVSLVEIKDKEIDEKNLEIRNLNDQLSKLKQTISWRISAPIRLINLSFFKKKKIDPLLESKRLIEKSGLFDKEWYLNEYPDVADSGQDPIEHYLIFGANECRLPNANFQLNLNTTSQHNTITENPLLKVISEANKRNHRNKRN